jgi:hypothetical protein
MFVPFEASWEQLSKLSWKVTGEIWQICPIRSARKAMALSLHFFKAVSSLPQLAHKNPLTKGKLILLPSPHR